MNWQSLLPLLILSSTLSTGLAIFCVPEARRGLRTTLNLGGVLTCIALIVMLLIGVYRGEVFETRIPLLPNMDLVLHADALSLLFVTLSGVLWGMTTIYAIGYLEGSPHRSRFFGFFSLCVFATIGVALAGNLITFLIFYELLTLTTFPLIAHRGTPASRRAARVYLVYTMCGGALLLAGVVWLKAIAGSLEFTAVGVLSQMPQLDPLHLQLIFVLMIAGFGVKAALVPLHGWLPIAMAAPAPVSALLHAVAVVKAGAFGIVRLVYDVYGVEFARELGLTLGLGAVAAVTIIYGSVRALYQDDLKKRLAYSTVSQVSYITLGVAIAGPIATIGGIVHLVNQGLMKITLFFCAGNVAETLGIHEISRMNGVGRRMPWTMGAFTLAALGMIGVPPMAGFVTKWYLGVGAVQADGHWVLAVLAVSSLLNAAYFLPIIHAVWFRPQEQPWPAEHHFGRLETHWMLLMPPLVTAALALAMGLLASSPVSPLSWAKLISAREYGVTPSTLTELVAVPTPQLWWVILIPLLVAAVVVIRGTRQLGIRLMPWAALPALAAAILPWAGANELPWLFFGSVIDLDDTDRIFMLLAGMLWLAAAVYARDYLHDDPRLARFCLFFLLAMSGNFGLILAQDIFGFITFFTLMSFAAYGLVTHSGSAEALHAGRVYMQWVVLGEIMLFAAFAGLTAASATLAIQPGWVSGLLLAGFGIKAGVFSLHMWLPKAHPVAPVPASALLSGIMVKAGVLGWLRFLPIGESSFDSHGLILMMLGLAGTCLGIVAGVVQRNPKTLLAYSTVSQMGIITTGIGAGLMVPHLWPMLSLALLVYVVHHGLTKATLFLGVGVAGHLSPGPQYRPWLWAAVLIPAVALAGMPLTGGALAKAALKASVTELETLVVVLQLSAIGTSLLMARFIDLLATTPAPTHSGRSGRWLALASLAPLAAGLVYLLPQARPFVAGSLAPGAIWGALWPILVGVTLYVLMRRFIGRVPPVPAGDIGLLVDAGGRVLLRQWDLARGIIASNADLVAGLLKSTPTWRVPDWGESTRKAMLDPGTVYVLMLLGLMLVFTIGPGA